MPNTQAGFVDRLWQIAMWCAYRLMIVFWFVFRPVRSGAGVIVRVGDDCLLVRNSYKREYSFPGGAPNRNETPAVTAARELYEETQIVVGVEDLGEGVPIKSQSEFKYDTATYFEIELDERPDFAIDNREIVFGEFVSFDSLITKYPLTDTARQYVEMKRKK